MKRSSIIADTPGGARTVDVNYEFLLQSNYIIDTDPIQVFPLQPFGGLIQR